MERPQPIRTPFGQRADDFRRRTLPIVVWVVAVLALGFLLRTRAARFEYVGVAVAAEYEVAPTVDGRIESLAVQLFDAVDAGDVVAVLDDESLRAAIETARATVERLQAELGAARAERRSGTAAWEADLRRFQIDEESRRLDVLALQVVIESDRVELERLALERRRAETLLAEGLISETERDNARLLHERVRQRIDENQVLLAQTRDELRAAESRRTAYEARSPRAIEVENDVLEPLQRAVAEQARRVHEIEVQRVAMTLRSPVVGQVSQILARRGAAVVAGEPVVTIAERDSHEIVAYLAETDSAGVRPDARVRIRSAAGGTVAESVVLRVAPTVQPLPQRLWIDPRVPDYGRPIVIAATPAMRLTPGELVGVRVLDR